MLFLAIRQLLSRPQQTILTLIGIMLGSAAYVTLSGIMLGFQVYITDQLINNDAQIRISQRDESLTEETFSGVFFPTPRSAGSDLHREARCAKGR